ncbi:hypothetical protein BDF20DRAFT_710856 [Mycotypha africana]|uniref:uncharacterized protein n=1 Tax=Mycotypha africana TaxID=64632 RepID=UPI0023003949|nr:uncharacterized protein BDF20DRAFT_710856 [Mycotypha africana]KAI8971947.1 hypothetical protein BDF20DRAFT_710856 [Mycotypha africana]
MFSADQWALRKYLEPYESVFRLFALKMSIVNTPSYIKSLIHHFCCLSISLLIR